MRILYGLLNEQPDIWCERAFAPWVDMEAKLREYKIPLSALESGDPLSGFDIVGFSLQYELCYTNLLNMLKLANSRCAQLARGSSTDNNRRRPAHTTLSRLRHGCFAVGDGEVDS